MSDRTLFRDGNTVIGEYELGLFVGTMKVATKGKVAGEELVRDKSYFPGGPRGMRMALLEALGRIADAKTCRSIPAWLKRLDEAILRIRAVADKLHSGR